MRSSWKGPGTRIIHVTSGPFRFGCTDDAALKETKSWELRLRSQSVKLKGIKQVKDGHSIIHAGKLGLGQLPEKLFSISQL